MRSTGLSQQGRLTHPVVLRRGDDHYRPIGWERRTRLIAGQKLRAAQKVFASTGGLHGAALFGADGSVLTVREDIGRHNAVDKVIGWALEADRIPLTGTVLLVSGRASFELTQKAVMAGIPVLAAVSAPSSLRRSTPVARPSLGLTLVGLSYARGDSMNVYTRPVASTASMPVPPPSRYVALHVMLLPLE